MKPIYIPKGAAREYGDYAINIYTGCPHRCYYCFAPSVLHRDREVFHSHVEPRPEIVEAVKKQIEVEQITGKLIHLCFTCDPYPRGYESMATRQIIEALKATGNHVQILTKNGTDGIRDLDLLDGEDWFGVTVTGEFENQQSEPGARSWVENIQSIDRAHHCGVKTWVSCEPVLDAQNILALLSSDRPIDRYKIGKLNYHPSDINWGDFGRWAEEICRRRGLDYYIKSSLREEMSE